MARSMDDLRTRLRSTGEIGDTFDWGNVSRELGALLPRDYVGFISQYGGGSINNSFHIALPIAAGESVEALTIHEATEVTLDLLEGTEGGKVPADRLIAWAIDAGANGFCWDTSAKSSSEWPVVCVASSGEMTVYDCGMIEFMCRLISSELDPMPAAIFSPEDPLFLNWRTEARIRESGSDPWLHL